LIIISGGKKCLLEKLNNISFMRIKKSKSKQDIILTLNDDNKLNGLLFMDQMFNYCDQEHKICKIVKHVYMEKMISPTAPLYILDGLRCDGISESFTQRCDRTCNLVWHEDWLEEN
jgi:hypothetical protein